MASPSSAGRTSSPEPEQWHHAPVTTREIVLDAVTATIRVAAFNVLTLEHAEALVTGAGRAGRPVVLQASENAVRFHGGRLGPISVAAAVATSEYQWTATKDPDPADGRGVVVGRRTRRRNHTGTLAPVTAPENVRAVQSS